MCLITYNMDHAWALIEYPVPNYIIVSIIPNLPLNFYALQAYVNSILNNLIGINVSLPNLYCECKNIK